MKKTDLTDEILCLGVREMESGLIDADLGGCVIKKRLPLPDRGKRSSVRTIVATRREEKWFYVFGFEKNERDNIDGRELKALREVAAVLLSLSDAEILSSIDGHEMEEIDYGSEE